MFFIVAALHKGSLFSASLLILVISCLFNNSHSDRCEVISCGFDLHFPDDYWCWKSFHMPVGHLYIIFGKMSILILCPFFNHIVCRVFFYVLWLLCLFWILTPCLYIICKYLFPFNRWTFNFIDSFLHCAAF